MSMSDTYQKDVLLNTKSKHWSMFYEPNKFGSKIKLEDLKDFRSNNSGLSRGLDDSFDNELSFKVFSDLASKVGYEFLYSNLQENNIGNSHNLLRYRDKYLDYNRLFHISWFKELEDKVFSKNSFWESANGKPLFCEIGGGFGSFSQLIIANKDIKLLCMDLPEANILSSYYLSRNFPDKSFFLYDDYINSGKNLTQEIVDKYDIMILPPFCKIDSSVKISLFSNTRSMMEMDFKIVCAYFEFIQKHIAENGYFLNVNRYEKRTVGEAIRIHEYPYDSKWKVISSESSFSQPHIHLLLTKRIFRPQDCDILNELQSIKNIAKDYQETPKQRIVNYLYSNIYSKLKRELANLVLKRTDEW